MKKSTINKLVPGACLLGFFLILDLNSEALGVSSHAVRETVSYVAEDSRTLEKTIRLESEVFDDVPPTQDLMDSVLAKSELAVRQLSRNPIQRPFLWLGALSIISFYSGVAVGQRK